MDQLSPGHLFPGDLVTIAIDQSGHGIWWDAQLFRWLDGHIVLADGQPLRDKLPGDAAPALVVCCERGVTPNTQRICVLSSLGFLAVTWIQFVDEVHYRSERVVDDPDA